MAATLEKLIAASQDASERRDARGGAALFHPNANVPLSNGEYGVGREDIERHLETVLPSMPDDVAHEVTRRNVHYVTADLAIIDTVGENYRITEAGRPEKLSKEGFTMIAVREEGEWLWAGIRGALVPAGLRNE